MLFKVSRKSVFEDNPFLKEIMEFDVCTSDTLKYVFLMNDYKSPYRQQPWTTRMKMVLDWLGIDKTHAKEFFQKNGVRMDEATKKFREMQYDDEVELFKAYQKQLRDWAALMNKESKTAEEERRILSIAKDMIDFVDNLHKLERHIGERIKDIGNKIGENRTALEIFMEDRKKRVEGIE